MAAERRDDSVIVGLMNEMLASIQSLREELKEHIDSEPATLKAAVDEVVSDITNRAFPQGEDGQPDLTGHRSAHQEQIASYRSKKEFWNKMTFELTKLGIVGFLAWSIHELWISFISGPGK